jgi:hypothetical protein
VVDVSQRPAEHHFSAFVDRIAADLDAIPQRATELAAQAHHSGSTSSG